MFIATILRLLRLLIPLVLISEGKNEFCSDDDLAIYHLGELNQTSLKADGHLEFSLEDVLGQMRHLKYFENEEDLALEERERLLLNQNLLEGDFLLRSNYTLQKLLNQDEALYGSESLLGVTWPNGIVPFAFEQNFTLTQQLRIVLAMKDIQDVSCVKFKMRTQEKAYIQFYKSQWCASHVGFQFEMQGLAVSEHCMKSHSVLLHLLMHALGFWHEHTRADRDQHITIQWKNVHTKFLCNFRKFKSLPDRPLPYDPNSILHLPSTAFAVSKERSTFTFIPPWTHSIPSGERLGLSKLDIQRILDKYDCYGRAWQISKYLWESEVPQLSGRLATVPPEDSDNTDDDDLQVQPTPKVLESVQISESTKAKELPTLPPTARLRATKPPATTETTISGISSLPGINLSTVLCFFLYIFNWKY